MKKNNSHFTDLFKYKAAHKIQVIGGRATQGKSLALVYLAQHPESVVICASEQGADNLQTLAKRLDLKPLNTKILNDK